MKTNNLIHLQFFPKECDIFSGRVLARLHRRACPTVQAGDILPILIISALGCLSKALIRPHPLPRRGPGRGLYYTYHINTMQNQKSTENQKNQLKTFFQLI